MEQEEEELLREETLDVAALLMQLEIRGLVYSIAERKDALFLIKRSLRIVQGGVSALNFLFKSLVL